MKWEGIILERKEKKEIENRVQDIREKVEMPSFLQRPWVKSKDKTVATDACSQHLLLYINLYIKSDSIDLIQIRDRWS